MVFRELIEARERLAHAVDDALAAIESGNPPPQLEHEIIDCKEEAGRRSRDGRLLPGEAHNVAAADGLAREVACLANTPGGGALIVGVENRTWQVLGAALDAEWLRNRIDDLVDVAPAIEERHLTNGRVLILYVAEAHEPIEDQDDKLHWRVGDNCKPVDRSEWWRARERRAGMDIMAGATARRASDAQPAALQIAREYLREAGDSEAATAPSDEALLRQLGVLRSDGYLSQAGSLLFCEAGRSLLTFAVFDVAGGNVLTARDGDPALSLLAQFQDLEKRLDTINKRIAVPQGLREAPVRTLPVRAVREAVLNGLLHRDWMDHEPTRAAWVEADGRLEVVSPGGFPGEIAADNVLTQREARYPALSDAFRALHLVDKQGLGVDRMYREMIALGHRPPEIEQIAGPRVRCLLKGGQPVLPTMALMLAIEPTVRQADVRIAILVYALLHQPFVTVGEAGHLLQTTPSDAEDALFAGSEATVRGEPLLRRHREVWLLGREAARLVASEIAKRPGRTGDLLTYRQPKPEAAAEVVRRWLSVHDRIGSSDYAELTGVSLPSASRTLTGMVGDLLERGAQARGRGAYFRRKQ